MAGKLLVPKSDPKKRDQDAYDPIGEWESSGKTDGLPKGYAENAKRLGDEWRAKHGIKR
jgi:hypothetical protein